MIYNSFRYNVIYFLYHKIYTYYYALRYRKDFISVKKFILFIGHGRSGHSLVGAILDSHPSALVSHQLRVLEKPNIRSKVSIFSSIISRARFYNKINNIWKDNRYSYKIGNWQGRFNNLEIIGDKSGPNSVNHINNFLNLSARVNVPIELIHVYRNPFDNIATIILLAAKRRQIVIASDLINKHIDRYFRNFNKIQNLKIELGCNYLDFKYEDLLETPEKSISELFRFFNLDIIDEIVSDCVKVIFTKPHQNRNKINWSDEHIEKIYRNMALYSILKDYSL